LKKKGKHLTWKFKKNFFFSSGCSEVKGKLARKGENFSGINLSRRISSLRNKNAVRQWFGSAPKKNSQNTPHPEKGPELRGGEPSLNKS